MQIIQEKIELITSNYLRRRVKREFDELIKNNVIYPNSVTIDLDDESCPNRINYIIEFLAVNDNNYYQFIFNSSYPFNPPKLNLNFKPYSYLYYLKAKSYEFNEKLFEYKKIRCLCCHTKLCSENWSPAFTMYTIINEVAYFKNMCIEISRRIFINVIKRKYLIDDINIIEWLY